MDETTQREIEGLKFANNYAKIKHSLWGRLEVAFPVASLLSGEEGKNNAKAKKALDSLSEKKFYYEDVKVWEKLFIINS